MFLLALFDVRRLLLWCKKASMQQDDRNKRQINLLPRLYDLRQTGTRVPAAGFKKFFRLRHGCPPQLPQRPWRSSPTQARARPRPLSVVQRPNGSAVARSALSEAIPLQYRRAVVRRITVKSCHVRGQGLWSRACDFRRAMQDSNCLSGERKVSAQRGNVILAP